jgi:hypothetical protein
MAAPTTAARVNKALANPEPSTHGPTLPTWAMQQVGGYLGYTGRTANVVAKAAREPERTFASPFSSRSVDPLTCDLPGPRIEHQAHRRAGPVAQERKTCVVAAIDEELIA